MNTNTLELLERLGGDLDRGQFPRITNGGFVLPSESVVSVKPMGKEKRYDQAERPRRPATESRPGAGRGQGATGAPSAAGPWAAGGASPVLGAGAEADRAEALSAVREAYSGVRVWEQGEGFWLWAESALLPGLPRKAAFLVGVSTAKRAVRSWGFWQLSVGTRWIGPRHTNFPDGSICAYDIRDFTWVFGQSLVTLLDFYSVWALRQLHLEIVGRWPGPQVATLPYEVALEVSDTELCPCGSERRYADCCKETFSARNHVADAIDYCLSTAGGQRCPPASVLNFVRNRDQPPKLADLI